jgi:hypothetical protein
MHTSRYSKMVTCWFVVSYIEGFILADEEHLGGVRSLPCAQGVVLPGRSTLVGRASSDFLGIVRGAAARFTPGKESTLVCLIWSTACVLLRGVKQ